MVKTKLLQGDCFEEMKKLEAGSVDLILTDPPYGTMKGAKLDGWGGVKTDWDEIINPKDIFKECGRVLRNNGKLVLFSQEPYTSKTITEAIPLLPFGYRMVWKKDHFANCLVVNKAPVSYFEDVLVFSKVHPKHDFEGFHPLRPYFEKVFNFIGLSKKRLMEKVGQGADHTFRFGSSQFSLCIKETYNKLTTEFNLCNMNNFIEFDKLKETDSQYRKDLINKMNNKYPSIFNLWEGNKLKSNILNYKKDYNGFHPTQKPVALLKDLIKTYSNEGDNILDFTMGSGSTGVACIKTGRNFIGMELDEKYFEIAKERINKLNSEEEVKTCATKHVIPPEHECSGILPKFT